MSVDGQKESVHNSCIRNTHDRFPKPMDTFPRLSVPSSVLWIHFPSTRLNTRGHQSLPLRRDSSDPNPIRLLHLRALCALDKRRDLSLCELACGDFVLCAT